MTPLSDTGPAIAAIVGLTVWLLIAVGLYVWYALALAKLFPKIGVESWKGWVPVLNDMEILVRGGVPGWSIVFAFIPFVSVYYLYLRVVAAHRIGTGFGRGAGTTVFAIVLPPLWATLLATAQPAMGAPLEQRVAGYAGSSVAAQPAPPRAAPPAPQPAAPAAPPPAGHTAGVPPVPPVPGVPPVPPVPGVPPVPLTPGVPPVPPAPASSEPAAPATPAVRPAPQSDPAPTPADAEPAPAMVRPAPQVAAAAPPPPTPPTPVAPPAPVVPATPPPLIEPVALVVPPPTLVPPAPSIPAEAPAAPAAVPPAPAAPAASAPPAPAPAPAAPAPAAPAATAAASATPASDDEDDFGETVIVERRPRIRFALQVEGGPSLPLTADTVVLGRKPATGVPGTQDLSVPDTTRTLSKVHARVQRGEEGWIITDLESTNGVVVVAADGTETLLERGASAPLTGSFVLGKVAMSIVEEGASA